MPLIIHLGFTCYGNTCNFFLHVLQILNIFVVGFNALGVSGFVTSLEAVFDFCYPFHQICQIRCISYSDSSVFQLGSVGNM